MSNQITKPSGANLPVANKATKFKQLFETQLSKISGVAASHLNPERQIRLALIAMNKVPKLLDCEPMTVLSCVITASQLGLEVGGPQAEAHLVPFKSECTLIIGYQGLAKLATNSGKVLDIETEVVYENDTFEYRRGLSPVLNHTPKMGGNRGEIICAYAIATLAGGQKHVEVMSIEDIDAIAAPTIDRAKRYGQQTPWHTNFAEMARKTMVRRICKYLPKSTELRTALEISDAYDNGDRVNLVEGVVVEDSGPTPKTAAINDAIKKKKDLPAPEPEPVNEIEAQRAGIVELGGTDEKSEHAVQGSVMLEAISKARAEIPGTVVLLQWDGEAVAYGKCASTINGILGAAIVGDDENAEAAIPDEEVDEAIRKLTGERIRVVIGEWFEDTGAIGNTVVHDPVVETQKRGRPAKTSVVPDAPNTPATTSSQTTWPQFMAECALAADTAGIPDDMLDNGIIGFLVSRGKKGKEETVTAEERAVLLGQIKGRTARFAK